MPLATFVPPVLLASLSLSLVVYGTKVEEPQSGEVSGQYLLAQSGVPSQAPRANQPGTARPGNSQPNTAPASGTPAESPDANQPGTTGGQPGNTRPGMGGTGEGGTPITKDPVNGNQNQPVSNQPTNTRAGAGTGNPMNTGNVRYERPFGFSNPQMESRFNEHSRRLVVMEQRMALANENAMKRLGEIRAMNPDRQNAALMDFYQQMLKDQAMLNQYLVQSRTAWTGEMDGGDGSVNPGTPGTGTPAMNPGGTPANSPARPAGRTDAPGTNISPVQDDGRGIPSPTTNPMAPSR